MGAMMTVATAGFITSGETTTHRRVLAVSALAVGSSGMRKCEAAQLPLPFLRVELIAQLTRGGEVVLSQAWTTESSGPMCTGLAARAKEQAIGGRLQFQAVRPAVQSQFESRRFHGNKFSATRGLVNDPVSAIAPPIRTKTPIVQNLCGWEGHDAKLGRQRDPQVFGLFGFAKTDAWTTLPTSQVPATIENSKLLRGACHSL